MKFRHKNPLYLDILIGVLAAGQIAMLLVNIFKFIGAFEMYSLMPTMEITQVVLSVLIFVACMLLMFMYYNLDKEKLKICFGFFDVTGGKFLTTRIRAAIRRKEDDGLYVSAYTNDVEPVIMKIDIAKGNYDKFITELQKLNPSVTVATD